MQTADGPQSPTTPENREICQDGDKTDTTAKPARIRSGENTLAYWRTRLFQNTYRDRQGRTIRVPEWYGRFRHAGVTKRIRLKTADKEQATAAALRLSQQIAEEGWTAVTRQQARLPDSPTIAQFLKVYEAAVHRMNKPPRKISLATYSRSLRHLCRLAGVSRIRDLTPEAVTKARDAYRAKAQKERRDQVAIENSTARLLRNAAAPFSKEARLRMRDAGLTIENPFADIPRRTRIDEVTILDASIVDRIWASLPLLEKGDPDATAPNLSGYRRQYRRKHGSASKARWLPVDFTQPHPEAAACVLLALGAGLRRNEADKARWSWIKFDGKGDCLIEIPSKETDFEPKGGRGRKIRIPASLHAALIKTRKDMSSPYVLGGVESPKRTAKGEGYRRPEVFRAVNEWLRSCGIEDKNPLHRLRKQFGCEVATGFGLFVAQKLLGHSSPTITSAHYAGLIDQPELTHVKIAS